jgi:hypothetical protein
MAEKPEGKVFLCVFTIYMEKIIHKAQLSLLGTISDVVLIKIAENSG